MDNATYKLTIGDWSVSSGDDPRTEVLRIEVATALNDPTSRCEIVLYLAAASKPSLLEQAVGAAAGAAAGALGLGDSGGAPPFSISVRGKTVKPGDKVTVELANGNRSAVVMTATVDTVESSPERSRIVAYTALHTFATTRVNRTYQSQNVEQMVGDLAQAAGVDTGDVDSESTYPYFLVHDSKSVFASLCELAGREGLDLYTDENNHLNVKAFSKSSADHTFYYGIDLLSLTLLKQRASVGHVTVAGEGAASSNGQDAWPWLLKDATSMTGVVGDGDQLLPIRDGAVRSKDAADQAAQQKLGAVKDGASRGRFRVLGFPTVRLGDAIEIKEAPKPELNGLFKVIGVRHILSKTAGFLTEVDFSGQGGAQQAAGLLGGLAGKLAGALGI